MNFEMRTFKPDFLDDNNTEKLRTIDFAPWIQLATNLIKKKRRSGGSMFRHQIDTFGILIEYGYIEPILLKASLIHDIVEDCLDFNQDFIRNCDEDGTEVLNLVSEVSKTKTETKDDFLKRIVNTGSQNAKILKCADRVSNMIQLGFVTDPAFIDKVCTETEAFILPIAIEVDFNMYTELIELLISRLKFLEQIGYFEKHI